MLHLFRHGIKRGSILLDSTKKLNMPMCCVRYAVRDLKAGGNRLICRHLDKENFN